MNPAPGRLAAVRRLLAYAAHALPVSFLFEAPLFGGQLPYFRDILFYYAPNFAFLAGALAQGVWPLWNPTNDAGAPFLVAYPVDVVLVAGLGAERALGLTLPVHVFVAACGATALGRRLGLGGWGAWCAGLLFAFSGFVLSTGNLFELLHGVAWAPAVVAAFLALVDRPTARRAALLALVAALQLSTLAAETVLQTGLMCVMLAERRRLRGALPGLGLAGGLAIPLALPTLLGVRTLLDGTQRQAGFAADLGFAWSLHPLALLDVVLPRFFGDPHTFSDLGFWGQPFFSSGYPYLLTLYAGAGTLVLALHAGRGHPRLWLALLLGVLLSLGQFGPLAWLLAPLLHSFRVPVKLFLLAALPLALLAGAGLERARRGRRATPALAVPGLLLLMLGALAHGDPGRLGRAAEAWLPGLASERASIVFGEQWPTAFVAAGTLATGAALALWAGPRLAPWAGLLAGLDLLIAHAGLNLTAPPSFYALRPEVASLVGRANRDARWFAYGAEACAPSLRWQPLVARRNKDDVLFALERQALAPRTPVFEGLDSAFDEDRVGLAPAQSTIDVQERHPWRFSEHHDRLRLAGVRWVLSLVPLADARLDERGQATLVEVLDPLRLYELRDPLPRAFWVPVAERRAPGEVRHRLADPLFDPRRTVLLEPTAPADPSGPSRSGTSVVLIRPGPQHVIVEADTPPGWIVVLEGWNRNWQTREDGRAIPLQRANGRYWALPTTGGRHRFEARYSPPWVTPAVGAAGAALALALGLAVRPARHPSNL